MIGKLSGIIQQYLTASRLYILESWCDLNHEVSPRISLNNTTDLIQTAEALANHRDSKYYSIHEYNTIITGDVNKVMNTKQGVDNFAWRILEHVRLN